MQEIVYGVFKVAVTRLKQDSKKDEKQSHKYVLAFENTHYVIFNTILKAQTVPLLH